MPRSLPLTGILIIVIGATCLGLKDGFAKLLVGDLNPVVLAWVQYTSVWVFMAGLVTVRQGPAKLVPTPFRLQAVRGLLITITPLQFFISTQYIQLAESHALLFTGPLLAVVWSHFFLKEHVGPHRWLAVLCGFLGIILVVRPDFSNAGIGHLFAFGSGVTQSFYFIFNKRLAELSSPMASIAHSVVFGTIILLPFAIWFAPDMGTVHLPNLSWFIIFSIAGQSLLILAFSYGPTSLIAPFHYSIIVSSILFGLVAFNQFPTPLTLLGIAIVISAGIYVAQREARAARQS